MITLLVLLLAVAVLELGLIAYAVLMLVIQIAAAADRPVPPSVAPPPTPASNKGTLPGPDAGGEFAAAPSTPAQKVLYREVQIYDESRNHLRTAVPVTMEQLPREQLLKNLSGIEAVFSFGFEQLYRDKANYHRWRH